MANLNQNIVVVNEFTINGSRGATPGNYVLEYMARDMASENLTPTPVRSNKVRKMEQRMHQEYKRSSAISNQGPRIADYVTRYMARDTATEVLALDGASRIEELVSEFDNIQGMSGVAFGSDSLSLSHDEVKSKAAGIQAEYEKGKPVMKTVISFDTDYLKQMGVLPQDVVVNKRGDLHGKTDQAKLRLAIQHGLKNIRHEYSDLEWIGVIQVDTRHVHCHLAMVDKGVGKRFARNGEQKGMLNDAMKQAIRRGIDNSLSQCQIMKPLSIQMEGERRNTISFIKRFTHHVMEERGVPQYLLACLPKDDKSLWKASINTDGGPDNVMTVRKGKTEKRISGNMKKANEIVRSYVTDLLNRPDSGFVDAMRAQHDYLIARQRRGDFDNYTTETFRIRGGKRQKVRVKVSPDEAVRIEEKKFREQITERGMNAVYDILKNIDDGSIRMHTPMLDAMSMPYEQMASYVKEDKLIEFGFKLRSYSSRLDYHRTNFEKISEYVHQYEDGDQSQYAPESRAVYDFLKIEQEYNHALMCKYQTFLHFYHVRDEYRTDHEELMFLRHRLTARQNMKNDSSIRKMTPENAERAGREIYGIQGASYLVTNPALYDQLMDLESREYVQGLRNFKEKLARMGMLYDEASDNITEGLSYDFDDVKAYDLHHMSYDFTYDFKIAAENVRNFANMAERRYQAYRRAAQYLQTTGQITLLSEIANANDIMAAKDMADSMRGGDDVYHTKYDDADRMRANTATIRLDHAVYDDLSDKKVLERLHEILSETGSETTVEEGPENAEDPSGRDGI